MSNDRDYRVRPAQPTDHPALACGAVTLPCIVVERLTDGRRWIFADLSGYRNTDGHAIARLIANGRAAMRLGLSLVHGGARA